MIKGKAKMEFGTGDIRMTSAFSNGIGALCCNNQEPHKIGEKISVDQNWNTIQSDVILTFSKTESIDAVINELKCVRSLMDDTFPEEEKQYRDEKLDFDAFMKSNVKEDK